jgi:hypothetical protein
MWGWPLTKCQEEGVSLFSWHFSLGIVAAGGPVKLESDQPQIQLVAMDLGVFHKEKGHKLKHPSSPYSSSWLGTCSQQPGASLPKRNCIK